MGIAKKTKKNFDCLFVKNKQKLQRGTSTTASLSTGGLEPQTSFQILPCFLLSYKLHRQAHSNYICLQ